MLVSNHWCSRLVRHYWCWSLSNGMEVRWKWDTGGSAFFKLEKYFLQVLQVRCCFSARFHIELLFVDTNCVVVGMHADRIARFDVLTRFAIDFLSV